MNIIKYLRSVRGHGNTVLPSGGGRPPNTSSENCTTRDLTPLIRLGILGSLGRPSLGLIAQLADRSFQHNLAKLRHFGFEEPVTEWDACLRIQRPVSATVYINKQGRIFAGTAIRCGSLCHNIDPEISIHVSGDPYAFLGQLGQVVQVYLSPDGTLLDFSCEGEPGDGVKSALLKLWEHGSDARAEYLQENPYGLDLIPNYQPQQKKINWATAIPDLVAILPFAYPVGKTTHLKIYFHHDNQNRMCACAVVPAGDPRLTHHIARHHFSSEIPANGQAMAILALTDPFSEDRSIVPKYIQFALNHVEGNVHVGDELVPDENSATILRIFSYLRRQVQAMDPYATRGKDFTSIAVPSKRTLVKPHPWKGLLSRFLASAASRAESLGHAPKQRQLPPPTGVEADPQRTMALEVDRVAKMAKPDSADKSRTGWRSLSPYLQESDLAYDLLELPWHINEILVGRYANGPRRDPRKVVEIFDPTNELARRHVIIERLGINPFKGRFHRTYRVTSMQRHDPAVPAEDRQERYIAINGNPLSSYDEPVEVESGTLLSIGPDIHFFLGRPRDKRT